MQISINNVGTLDGANIVEESMTLQESICSESQLLFGCCEASVFKIRLIAQSLPIVEKDITVSIPYDGQSFQLGKYKVFSDKPTADRRYRDIVAYDAMYDILNADVAVWYNTILPNANSTVTMKEFRDSFFSYFGIEQEEVALVNDDIVVTKTIEPSQLSGKTVITAICEINGCFGHIGRNGKFQYVYLPDSMLGVIANAEEISSSIYINAEYEDFSTEKINKLQIRQEENDIGCIYGTGDNCYIVQDNFLVYGKSSSELEIIAQNLYSVISTVQYNPAHVEAKGNPCLEVGDGVYFTANGKTIYTYILQRTLKGIQALRDTYDADGEQYQSEKVNSVHDDIIQLKGKANILKRTIEELSVTITDKEQGLSSRIEQNASSISTEVSRAKSAEESLDSKISQTDSKISVEVSRLQKEIDGDIKTYNVDYVPTLLNYPAWDFTYNIPCDGTVKLSDTLKFEYTDEYYSKNARSVAFDESTFITYKFMKDAESGKWYWREVADSDYSYVMQQLAELKIEADNISSTVSENKTYSDGRFSDLSSKITQTASSIESEVSRATTAEGNLSSRIMQTAESISSEVTRAKGAEENLSSKIEQTASSIRAEVSSGYATKASLELKIDKSDTGQIVSMINASADEINLKGNRISIVSDYFTLEHSGRITAVSGNIGGWDIGSYGIKKESPHGKVLLQSDGTMAMYDTSDNVIWSLQCDGKVLLPGYADIGYLNAVSARVGYLEADHVSVENLNAVSARVGYLEADHVSVENLNAVSAKIDNLDVNTLLAKTSIESSVAYLKGIHVKKIWDSTGMGLKIIWKYSSTLGTWYISGEPSN